MTRVPSHYKQPYCMKIPCRVASKILNSCRVVSNIQNVQLLIRLGNEKIYPILLPPILTCKALGEVNHLPATWPRRDDPTHSTSLALHAVIVGFKHLALSE